MLLEDVLIKNTLDSLELKGRMIRLQDPSL